MSAQGPVSSVRAGEAAETSVLEAIPQLSYLRDSNVKHADARVDELLEPSDVPLVGMCLLETGTLVEVKSAIVRKADGERGRFYLREGQHSRLLEDSAIYLFAVTEPKPTRPTIALKLVPASIVDELLEGRWRDVGEDRQRAAQLSWGRIFDSTEVSR